MNLKSTSREDPAEAAVGISEPGTGYRIQNVQNLFAVVECIQERGNSANVQQVSPKPEQVARYAVQLRGYHPNVFRSLRDLYPGELFDRQDKSVVEHHPGQVIHSARVGEKLLVLPVFPHLFVTPVAVSDNRVGSYDILAVEVQQNPQNAVRAGMLRPKI